VVTDIHYADRERSGTRYYRDSMQKLREAIAEFNRADLDFVIELGDMKDTTKDSAAEPTMGFLRDIERLFQSFDGPVYHVLGNHDMDCISKEEFLAATTNAGRANGRSYYSFVVKNTRCIVLDANFNLDGNPYSRGNFDWTKAMIPQEELEWLEQELAAHSKQPTLIFVHQMLDSFSTVSRKLCVSNAEKVVEVLERNEQVLAVIQGHHHPGHHSHRAGIHYLTLNGMIEKSAPEHNSYAIVEVMPDGDIIVEGFRDCPDRVMRRGR
jgi:alkaline phosphatase